MSYQNLLDMLTFDRVDFEKNISLSTKKKVKIESKWKQIRLDNITTLIKRGKSPSYGKSNVQIIKSGQTRGFYEFDFSKKYYVSEDFTHDERKLQKGDLLLNSSGVGTAGRVTGFFLEGDFVVDGHISILRFDKAKVLPKYVLNVFGSIGFKTLESLALGQSGQIEISYDTIAAFKIPLPPKDIQEKIVAEIEVLEKEEKKAAEEIGKLKEEITDFYSSSESHLTKSIDQICELKSGLFVRAGDISKVFSDELYPCYGGNGLRGYTKTFTNEGSDSLVGRQGALCGNVHWVSGQFHATEHALVAYPKDNVDSIWLHYKLVHMNLNQYATGAAQPGLSVMNLKPIQVQLPPLKEQQKVVAQIQKRESEIAELEKQIAEMPKKKDQILKKYLE